MNNLIAKWDWNLNGNWSTIWKISFTFVNFKYQIVAAWNKRNWRSSQCSKSAKFLKCVQHFFLRKTHIRLETPKWSLSCSDNASKFRDSWERFWRTSASSSVKCNSHRIYHQKFAWSALRQLGELIANLRHILCKTQTTSDITSTVYKLLFWDKWKRLFSISASS